MPFLKKNSEVENITGKVDFVNPKFAFIRYDDNESDVFVPADDLNGALDGDTVKVVITGKRRGGKIRKAGWLRFWKEEKTG